MIEKYLELACQTVYLLFLKAKLALVNGCIVVLKFLGGDR